MYNLPGEFIQALSRDDSKILVEMDVVFSNGTTLFLDNSKIWKGSLKVASSTSEGGNFTLGMCVANKLTFSLNNIEGEFNEYDFIDAVITLRIGMMLESGKYMLNYGIYTISNATSDLYSVDIAALDNLSKLSHRYAGGINFPINLHDLVVACCDACGITVNASSIPAFMSQFRAMSLPNDNSLTYASLVGYAAQIGGCFVKCQPNGQLKLGFYDFSSIEPVYDGGTFKTKTIPYSDGAELDGGTFAFDDTEVISGGTFVWGDYHTINQQVSLSMDTDLVEITGVFVTSIPNDNLEGDADSFIAGTDEYLIDVSNNPLVQRGQAEVVASHLLNVLEGMSFRPLNATILINPAIEAGDVGLLVDPKGRYHRIFFSNVTFCPDATGSVSCDAQSKNRQSASNSSLANAVLQKAKQFVAGEKSARENAIAGLQTEIDNASGFYESVEDDGQGGLIYYQHNQPTLEQSTVIWKETATTRSVSTDGGKTWNFAMNADGNAIANRLSVTGIDANWINTGTLKIGGSTTGAVDGAITVYDADDNLIFSSNKEGVKIVATGLDGSETIIEGGKIKSNSAEFMNGRIRIASAEDTDDLIQLTLLKKDSSGYDYWNYASMWNSGFRVCAGSGTTYNSHTYNSLDMGYRGLQISGEAYVGSSWRYGVRHRIEAAGIGFNGKYVQTNYGAPKVTGATADEKLDSLITILKNYGLLG